MAQRKRFKTRKEITSKIDSVKKQFESRSIEAARCGQHADECFKNSAKAETPKVAGECVKDGQHHRSKERKLLKQIKSTPERLDKLKRTLAAFDTAIMPIRDGQRRSFTEVTP